MKNLLDFLSLLKKNNDREWFNDHKSDYSAALETFKYLSHHFLMSVLNFDEEMKNVEVKKSIFRIYRDIRFSKDKTPYKTHFAGYFAFPNGRKSHRGGYYLHIEPQKSFLGVGVWKPEKSNLNNIRWNIVHHYEDFNKIIENNFFVKTFGTNLYNEDKLKKIPAGFPKDFPDTEILKYKHFVVIHSFEDKEVIADNFIQKVTETAYVAYPFLQFLNNAIDENN